MQDARRIKDTYSEEELKAILKDHANLNQSYSALFRIFGSLWNDCRDMTTLFSEEIEEVGGIDVPVTRQQLGLDENDEVNI